MTLLENAIARVRSAGYRVLNLFERDDGMWQANVVAPDGKAHEFGVSRTPGAALHLAMTEAAKHELAWRGVTQAVDVLTVALRRLNGAMEGGGDAEAL